MKYGKGIFAGAVTAVLGVKTAAAQFIDTASAGNGGVATASGNGGAVSAGDINSGGNVGSAIAVGDTDGPDPEVYGGDILNQTGLGRRGRRRHRPSRMPPAATTTWLSLARSFFDHVQGVAPTGATP